jgi:hypothetical protein
MNPKKHKVFKKGIAEEVGVHESVVDDFISFYYSKLRSKLSNLDYPRIQVDGLGTFILRKSKLNKAIMKNKSLLGNIAKRTYNGFAKSEDIKRNIIQMEKVMEQIEKNILAKKNFKDD